MAKQTGKNGKVMYGSIVVAEQVAWSMSGFTQPVTSAPTAFGDTGVKTYEIAELGEGGTIEFNGTYDPSDAGGQQTLDACCAAGYHLTNLYFYFAPATYWSVGAGGYIILTKAKAPNVTRSGYPTIAYSAQVSTQAMTQNGTGS
jgi:hypothetical protein